MVLAIGVVAWAVTARLARGLPVVGLRFLLATGTHYMPTCRTYWPIRALESVAEAISLIICTLELLLPLVRLRF